MEDAKARRERLKALRQAAAAAEGGGDLEMQEEQAAEEGTAPVLKFRNYALRDEKISHEQVAPAKVPKFEEPAAEKPPTEQDVAASVAPKKPNWDLRREVAPKLDRLERRTQRAMVQLLQQEERARLEEEGGVGD